MPEEKGSCVQMELELGDSNTALTLTVPLLHAQILMLFLEKERWTIDELEEQTGLQGTALKSRLQWWCNKGLLIRAGLEEITLSDIYALNDSPAVIEQLAKTENEQEEAMNQSDEEEEVPLETQVEELEQYWPYTKNLLQFSGTVTAQRLLSIYKHFGSADKPAPSLESIQLFMQKKIRENLVVIENGTYKATKN
ncbi:cullin family domain-containing protein [Ditylenchus destructor]|uniref:Cullin family domain-containing protein n=1 Tax=Ditylenchus destructor TaxID=166010 RepID=A0AAD4N2F5_9BILA|nr:cullin family domain-containing protein [Ditylenchus destructor]